MYKILNRFPLLAVILFFLSGCATTPNEPLYKTQEPINHAQLYKDYRIIKQGAEAKISIWFFVLTPLKFDYSAGTDVAVMLGNKILSEYDGEFLTSAKVNKHTFISIYWNSFSYSMTADVWGRK